ncbi:conjugative transfer protein MobI(A/C) [Photorhabdus heterorhabditis]|uniref:conjugative transfer protein MobI(A/C) n=1 Tax=Photorhabdus heterorhabditis TaxID=880156 RepID=UPI001561E9EF|nr:conjugative transfer protein MobI(A/C) [Photorhabdus heterorhabditis]NRN29017.1 plasmid transfer protein [Photorhabdus heterorhabditis subsp. aluminescens]
MKEILIETLKTSRKETQRGIDRLVEEANAICNEYWKIFQAKNKKFLQESQGSVGKNKNLGRYAPKVTVVGDGKKQTITWNDYAPRLKGVPCLRMSLRVSTTKRGAYSISCFPKHKDWEWLLIKEFEGRLSPLRETLECLHAHNVTLARKIRKYS